MGALRDHTDRNGLRRLSEADEMDFVAGGHQGVAAGDAWLTFLKANPSAARELGAITEKVRDDLKRAYPGETREKSIPNADWERAGYGRVVEMNRLMGLEGL